MLGLFALCISIIFFAHVALKAREDGKSISVQPIRSFDDYFIDFSPRKIGDKSNDEL